VQETAELSTECEVKIPKAPSVECEVEVEVEVKAPKSPKMPSVECEVGVEVPYGRQVFQCQIDKPGVGYRNTPSFADKVPDGTGPESPNCIIATAMQHGPQAVFIKCASGRGWLPLTNPSGSRICFKHLGAEGELNFEKEDLHLADGSVKFSPKKNADWYKKGEAEVKAAKAPSVECEGEVKAPKAPKALSVECEVVEVMAPKTPKTPSVECEVEVDVEVEAPKTPKPPSVECEVEVEAPTTPKTPSVECEIEVEVEEKALKEPSVECELEVEVKFPKMPSMECEVEVEIKAPKAPSVECEVEVEVPKAPKAPSVGCEVEVEVEVPKSPKSPSVECEVEVEVEVEVKSPKAPSVECEVEAHPAASARERLGWSPSRRSPEKERPISGGQPSGDQQQVVLLCSTVLVVSMV